MLSQLKKKETLVKRNTQMKEELNTCGKKIVKKMSLRPQ